MEIFKTDPETLYNRWLSYLKNRQKTNVIIYVK